MSQMNVLEEVAPDEYAKLSHRLGMIATQAGVNSEDELKLRREVAAASQEFARSRYDLGRALMQYRAHWKAEGLWRKVCDEVAAVTKVSTRTVLRVVDDYSRVSGAPQQVIAAVKRAGLDPAAKRNARVVAAVTEAAKEEMPPAELEAAVSAAKASYRLEHRRPKSAEEEAVSALADAICTQLSGVASERRFAVFRAAVSGASARTFGMRFDVTCCTYDARQVLKDRPALLPTAAPAVQTVPNIFTGIECSGTDDDFTIPVNEEEMAGRNCLAVQ